MLTTTAIANQYAFLYTPLPIPAGTWDHVLAVDGAYCAIKVIDGIAYLMFRGSVTFLDWRQDFQDFALPVDDPLVGHVHPGFRAGVALVGNELDFILKDKPVVCIGHSLGAGHAAVYAGKRRARGMRVDGVVLFGSPKPGGPKLTALLADVVDFRSYRNANASGHDLVTDVPFTDIPQLPYQHPRPLTDCQHDPSPLDPWVCFRFHHYGHYARAFGCGSPQALSLPI